MNIIRPERVIFLEVYPLDEKKKPKTPTFPLKERLSDNEYMKLKRFAQDFMGLEKNYAKHAKRKSK